MHAKTIVLAFGMLLPLQALASGIYHAPTTEAEKSLDSILKRADIDEQKGETLPVRYGPVTQPGQLDYSQMMTKRLIAGLLNHDKATVKRECTQGEHAGPQCVVDTIPLACISNDAATYVYRTLHQSPRSARIAYSWSSITDTASENAVIASYSLVKDHGLWKIDVISCTRHNGE